METIALRTRLSGGVNLGEVRRVLSSALRHEVDLAGARRTYFERACRTFEQQHQMSSEEFMQQFESGALGDEAVYFDCRLVGATLSYLVGGRGLNARDYYSSRYRSRLQRDDTALQNPYIVCQTVTR